MASIQTTPYYFIYGEPIRDIDPRFIHVERVSDRDRLHHGRVEPHSHPHLHQLSYWLGGHGHFSVDGEKHELAPDTLTWMPASVVHGFEIGATGDAIVLSLSHDFLASVMSHFDPCPVHALCRSPLVTRVPADLSGRMREVFLDLEREHQFPSWGLKHVVSAQVQLVMILLARLNEAERFGDGSPQMENKLFTRFLGMLERHFRDHRNVDAYASLLGTTPYLLNRACRDGTGQNASKVIRGRLVLEAKRLLHYTALTAGEVALFLGFSDPAHFGRTFRAEVGLSPARWRTQQQLMTGSGDDEPERPGRRLPRR